MTEEDLQQRIGHLFLKEKYPMLREVGLPKQVFDVTFKKGEFPDFVFFEDKEMGFPAPFIVELKHQKKIINDYRQQLGRQLNLAQDTVVNKNLNLEYGYVWNIVQTDFETDTSTHIEKIINDTLTKFENEEEEAEKNSLLSKLLNLYILEFHFYSVKDEDRKAVLKKIKNLIEIKEFKENLTDLISEIFISDFKDLNKRLNPNLHNTLITDGMQMKIVKPEVKVEVELWRINSSNKKELAIELIKRSTYG
mgnify:CR=1 FL=1